MEFRLKADLFWQSKELMNLYEAKAGNNWHLAEEKAQKVTRLLGMEFILSEYDEMTNKDTYNDIFDTYNDIFYRFKIFM